jgi:hypothetical protein
VPRFAAKKRYSRHTRGSPSKSFVDDSVIIVRVRSTPSTVLIIELSQSARLATAGRGRIVCVVACAAFLTPMRRVTG